VQERERERQTDRHEKCLQHFSQTNKDKRSLGRFTRRWRDNIKAKYRKIGHVDVNSDWVQYSTDVNKEIILVSTTDEEFG